MPHPTTVITPVFGPQHDRRRVPRLPFSATSVVTEDGSAQIVVAQATELSRFGCFVQTIKPYPKGSRVHLELSDGGDVFVASGAVAYVTPDGMGIVFSMVESHDYEILTKWLARTPRRSIRYTLDAKAEVTTLGSQKEQVLVTRDLSASGCFLKTSAPLPSGSRIRVRISHAGQEFNAIARVSANISAEGMGIEFVEVESNDRAVLEKWLSQEAAK
ncbi:MAG TPA: PilZ domain-containing protein [Candidatus Acidoferrales bacterium]|jgi:hypothetical protein|nr:PilZ domain-containing protein [Candidatus Acidoferrales bacterium]